jgi:hypothetical protein
VVIATVFLSIIGISVGLVLASRDRGDAAEPAPPPVVTNAPESPEPDGPACREETQVAGRRAGAQGELVQVLRLRTGSSEVYICRDAAGSLYYHANNGGDSWVENKTALFLTGVVRDGDDYEATASDGATFSVNTERLLIVHTDGREEEQRAAG